MRTTRATVVAVLAMFVVTQAHAMRWYSPNTGRWFCRDPIQETGGANVYGFTLNNAVGSFDVLGQYPSVPTRYSLWEMQAMLHQSKEDFRRKIKALCPISQPAKWKTLGGEEQCCTPDACLVQADVLTLDFAERILTDPSYLGVDGSSSEARTMNERKDPR